jgi:hypothetical protein
MPQALSQYLDLVTLPAHKLLAGSLSWNTANLFKILYSIYFILFYFIYLFFLFFIFLFLFF